VGELAAISNRLRHRAPSRFTLACLGLCALIVLAATVDLLHTESRLPDVSMPPCPPESASCRDAMLDAELALLRAADPLQDQYDSRAWLYASAILGITAIATGYALRSRPQTAWAGVFTNLGVIGVWAGIAAVVLLVATDGLALAPPPGPTLLLPVALVVAAVAGTLIGRSEGWAERTQVSEMVMQAGKLAVHVGTAGQAKRSRIKELARLLTLAALALTALSCLLALVSLLGEPGCGGDTDTPGWADPLGVLAAITTVGGMAAGIGALLLRHWIAALASLVLCPIALLVVLVSTCAFY
jgi:hypothetical protein